MNMGITGLFSFTILTVRECRHTHGRFFMRLRMADIKWIKITTDIFDNKKIRIIESMPEGDSIIVIWFKILVLAGNINDNGFVYFTKDIPYTDQMLSTVFNRPLTTIQMALNTFEKFGMIEIVDDIIHVSNWEKYQNVDGMEKIREQTRLRVARCRKNKKLECNVTSSVTVTQCNDIEEDIDKDIDIEKEREKEKEKDIKKENRNAEIKSIIDYFNSVAGKNYKYTSKANRSHILARLKEGFTLDDFKAVIDKKTSEWKNDSKMEQYLRPETLFGTKFEGYLNQSQKKKQEYKQEIIEEPTEDDDEIWTDEKWEEEFRKRGL